MYKSSVAFGRRTTNHPYVFHLDPPRIENFFAYALTLPILNTFADALPIFKMNKVLPL